MRSSTPSGPQRRCTATALAPAQVLILGAEHQLDQIDSTGPITAQMTNDAGYLQLQSGFGERFFNTTSFRFDDNDRFGSQPTFRLAPAFLIPETDTKLKGSVGTGFNPPTLVQLFQSFPDFNFFANPNLKPETSLGFDAGFVGIGIVLGLCGRLLARNSAAVGAGVGILVQGFGLLLIDLQFASMVSR